MNKRYFFIFLLIFLFFPIVTLAEDIDIQDKIALPEKYAKDILHSLIQILTDEWIELTTSPDSKPEEQAALITVRRAVRVEILHYFFIEAPREVAIKLITTTLKVVYLVYTGQDLGDLISKIEKLTVDEAKKYAMEWLLQKEIKVATGNLPVSYESYKGNKQEITLPYIMIYKPLSSRAGELGISIYSSKLIEPPKPKGDPWSASFNDFWFLDEWLQQGNEELDPFIVRINGRVEKSNMDTYNWIGTPKIEVSFSEEVPELDFPKPSFWQKTIASLKEKLKAVENAVELIEGFVGRASGTVWQTAKSILDKIKSFFSGLNPFKAAVAPVVKEIEEEVWDEKIEELKFGLGQVEEELVETGSLSVGMVDRLDDISEEIDVLAQEVVGLTGEREEGKLEQVEEIIEEAQETIEQEIEEAEGVIKEGERGVSEGMAVVGGEPAPVICSKTGLSPASRNKVIINEVAWMGSEISSADEWIELKNISGEPVDLTGWQLLDKDGQIEIVFKQGVIEPGGFFLLERTNDTSVPHITADLIYTGALNDNNEILYLFDPDCQLEDIVEALPDWPAGDKLARRSMERSDDLGPEGIPSGSYGASWHTFSGASQSGIWGTPRAENSQPTVVYYGGGGGGAGGGAPPPAPETQTLSPKILITEVQIKGEKANYDFVELYNPEDQVADLSGWQLRKKNQLGNEYSLRLLPQGSIIESKNYFLWASSKDGYDQIVQADASSTSYLTTNNSIAILNPGSHIIDALAWGEDHTNPFLETSPFPENSQESQSLERKKDSNDDYIDTDNNSEDFELQNCPNPKEQVVACYSPPEEEQPSPEEQPSEDTTPPEVSFELESIQTTLSFTVSWSGIDPVVNTTPSGVDGFLLCYSQDQENWNYWPSETQYTPETQYQFTGQDQKTYYFQVKAKDKAGNESDWASVQTIIELPEEEQPPEEPPEEGGPNQTVVINEIAWMGTKGATQDEWLELKNNTSEPIEILDWQLLFYPPGQTEPRITTFEILNGATPTVDGLSFFLLERTDDTTVSDIPADYIFKGALNDEGGNFELRDNSGVLIDRVDCPDGWFAGQKINRVSMERIDSQAVGSDPANWKSNNLIIRNGKDVLTNDILGTPRAENSGPLLENVVYIDDDFEDDSENHLFNTIEEGVADAEETWQVLVFDGEYKESVVIEKQISLQGTDLGEGGPVLDAYPSAMDVFVVETNGAEIEGFKIKNASAGIYLVNSNNNILKNNIFEMNSYAIYLKNSNNNKILDNTVNNKRYAGSSLTSGIYLESSNNNILKGNKTLDWGKSNYGETHGIFLLSSNNNILENNISHNNKGTGDGIYLRESHSNTLKRNTLTENNRGLTLVSSNNNFLENNLADNNLAGISLAGFSEGNVLKGNSMAQNCIANFDISKPEIDNDIDTTNLVEGKPIYYLRDVSDVVVDSSSGAGLVYCINCQNVLVKDLILDGRNNRGIYFYQTSYSTIKNVKITESVSAVALEESNNNLIEKNHFWKNFRAVSLSNSNNNKISENIMEENDSQGFSPCVGISPMFAIHLEKSSQNEIFGNLIKNNPKGIELIGSSSSNTIWQNTLENNSYYGVNVACSYGNLFYHNNFIDNFQNNWGSCAPYPPINQWYHLDLKEGNYYSGYDEPTEGCDDLNNNNICDAPYSQNNDEYPFNLKNGWLP